MTQKSYHLSPMRIGDGEKSVVLWSKNPSGRALIFVHGFYGRSLSTWGDFSLMMSQSPAFYGHDLIFYGYESVFRTVSANAAIFEQMLNTIFVDPITLLRHSLGGEIDSDARHLYKSITVISHSMGSVIARRALANAVKKKLQWTLGVQLVMFAPAHKGIYTLPMLVSCLKIIPKLKAIPRIGFRGLFISALQDLQPNSPILERLEQDVVQAVEHSGSQELRAECIVHATNDVVVVQLDLPCDPEPSWAHGRDHMNVCKPNREYAFPFEAVKSKL